MLGSCEIENTEQDRNVEDGGKRAWTDDGGEAGRGTERGRGRCEILCIFNTSTARQSILSEVLGTGGKTWTREVERRRGGGRKGGGVREVKGRDE